MEAKTVEVKIGIDSAQRELVLESALTPEQIGQALTDALREGQVLTLADEKGGQVLIPVAKISYIELAHGEARRIGFGR